MSAKYWMGLSEDKLAVKPLFLVSASSDVQLRVGYCLLVPLPVSLTEQRFLRKSVEVNHLIVDEHRVAGFGEL